MADRFAFSPETLIKAYSLGVFPMADSADSTDIRFYDPDVRALIRWDGMMAANRHSIFPNVWRAQYDRLVSL